MAYTGYSHILSNDHMAKTKNCVLCLWLRICHQKRTTDWNNDWNQIKVSVAWADTVDSFRKAINCSDPDTQTHAHTHGTSLNLKTLNL